MINIERGNVKKIAFFLILPKMQNLGENRKIAKAIVSSIERCRYIAALDGHLTYPR